MLKLDSIDGSDVAEDGLFTIAEIREWCYETSTSYDTLLAALVTASREYAEGRTWRQIIPATYTLRLDDFPEVIDLWKCPVISVTSVKYYDSDDTLQTLSSSLYQVDIDSEPARIKPVDGEIFPTIYNRMNAVEVEFSAGYDASDAFHTIPKSIKIAIQLLTHDLYNNRDDNVNEKGNRTFSKITEKASEILLERYSLREFV